MSYSCHSFEDAIVLIVCILHKNIHHDWTKTMLLKEGKTGGSWNDVKKESLVMDPRQQTGLQLSNELATPLIATLYIETMFFTHSLPITSNENICGRQLNCYFNYYVICFCLMIYIYRHFKFIHLYIMFTFMLTFITMP